MTHRFRYLAALLALTLAAFSPAFAQGTNGLIEGTVVDQQGLPLPGVVVTATNTSTGFSRSASTDNGGKYRIGGLVVGVYEVKAALSGFNAQAHKASVNVESTTAVPFRMSVAGQTENVEVTAEAPGDRAGGAGAEEGIEDDFAWLGGGEHDAMQQGFRFLRGVQLAAFAVLQTLRAGADRQRPIGAHL